MPSRSAPKNPPWNRDELSLLVNGLRRRLGEPHNATLRNANGVYMKLMNFRRFDPVFISKGRAGLSRGNKLEADVWREFHDDPSGLSRVAAAIRAGIDGGVD